jgi:hypothetical protein
MRIASCRCGTVIVRCEGEPVRISVCHCLECKRRTGSAFSAQARFPARNVQIEGATKTFERIADGGRKATYSFCPECGSTVAYVNEGMEGVIAVPMGAFADPDFPPPRFSVYEHRKHPWVEIVGDDVVHESEH